jgi:hypothetical protein
MKISTKRCFRCGIIILLHASVAVLVCLWICGRGYTLTIDFQKSGAICNINSTKDSDLKFVIISGPLPTRHHTGGLAPAIMFGCGWLYTVSTPFTRHAFILYIHYWLPILMILISEGFLWRRQVKLENYSGTYLCRQCGYDLRAHKPGDKCPECGTVIPKPGGGG